MVPCYRQQQHGRCSEAYDWIGRESGYADFADEHVSGTGRSVNGGSKNFQAPFTGLAPYFDPTIGCHSGTKASCGVGKLPSDVLMLSQRNPRSTNCNMESSADVLTLSDHNVTVNCNGAPLLSRNVVSANCNAGMNFVIPAPICDTAEPVSFQSPEMSVSSNRACQVGPVDVEDLALYFDVNKISSNCPQAQSQQQQNRCSKARIDQTIPNQRGDQRQQNLPWYTEDPYCGNCQGPFSFCNEQRWLQCPASDRCPLYDNDVPYTYNKYLLPPCLYENFQNGQDTGEEYWPYACTEDGQLLEEYLSNEKRKERSRDAARCRRSRETDIFTDLAAALPVEPEQAAHLDKASVMRLAIAYLKVRAVVDSVPGPLAKSESSEEMDELFPKALNGFMLVLSSDGNMVYLSENVSDYLGVSQMDMMGQSVYEYSHPCDHDELRECLSSKLGDSDEKRMCSFFLRLKCTLTNKGRKVNLKSASYKVIHCTGRLTHVRDANSNTVEMDDEERGSEDESVERGTGASLVLVGCPIPHPSNIEIPLGRDTFLSKHSLSMKFTYADEKLAEYLGWNSDELVGQSVFEFHHALDNLALDKSFKSLFSKGQCETVAYRFLSKKGGYAWVVTQATLIQCSKQHKPLSIVCVNYVLSGVEHEHEVYSARQLAARESANVLKEVQPSPLSVSDESPPPLSVQSQVNDSEVEDNSYVANVQQDSQILKENRTRPLAVTASIFRSSNPDSERKDRSQEDEDEDGKQKVAARVEGGSRKDQTFPRPVPVAEKSFTGVQSLKESLEEVLKENEEPARKRPTRKTEFIFQGKPAVDYDPEAARRNRPQAVTRHLFAPLAPVTAPQPQQEQIPCRPPPQTATASIFAPRTEDMNKGFLTFSEDQPGLTMLKDEPEDLTHLAPTPGDVCVPLEDTPFLSDMLDEFILGNDNYCPLLSPGGALTPELRGTDLGEPLKGSELVDSARVKNIGDPLADSDPFMYGDSPGSPCSIDPNSISPALTKYRQSPERSLDSLGSPTGGSGGEGLSEDEMLMLGISDSIGDDELALRAPYIPMSDQDEALELLISDDMVMWGADDKGSSKWLVDEREERGSDSSLAQLLRTDQIMQRRYNDHGGGLVNPAQVLGQIPRKNATLDSNRWSSKMDRIERPTKRIHTPTADSLSENKRIRCEDTSDRNIPLRIETQLLSKGSSRRSSNMSDSQLLRRLVSQQSIPRCVYGVESRNEMKNNSRHPEVRDSGERLEEETDGDSGGDGGGGGRRGGEGGGESEAGGGEGGGGCRRGDRVFNTDNEMQILMQNGTSSSRHPPCSSVLMNLLVSGCDDTILDSRSVPSLLERKDLITPLSVELDNQMVPECPSNGTVSSFDQFSPDARKQLLTPMMSSGSSLISPSSTIMPFDNFYYDVTGNGPGLLQVGTDLFGTLLDRNLV